MVDELSKQGMPMDFLQKEHYQSPRRVFRQTGSDWQRRVDFNQMRIDRLEPAKAIMEKHDMDAIIMYKGEN